VDTSPWNASLEDPRERWQWVAKQIAGDFITSGSYYHAYVWDPTSGKHDLGTLSGLQNADSSAWAINLPGQVVGESSIAKGGPTHAFLWTATDGMSDLGTLGGSNSYAYAISRTGLIAGASFTPDDSAYHAVIWQNGGIVDLGTLGGTNSGASGINSSGEVAGSSDVP
jgi:probable HAF family extracellular repeat protein